MSTPKTTLPQPVDLPRSCSPLETSDVRWQYEDELPEMEDCDFDAISKATRVDVVRIYPFVEDSKGNRIWITHLPSDATNLVADAEAALSAAAKMMKDTETKEGSIYYYWQGRYDEADSALDRVRKRSAPAQSSAPKASREEAS